MHIGARGLREALKKILNKFGLKIADAPGGESGFHNAKRATAKIDVRGGQRFVHGHQKVSGTQNAAAIAERGVHGFSQRDAGVLDGVVLIHVEVALDAQAQVQATTTRDQIEHVVEETNARGNVGLTASVEIQL